MSEDKLRAAVLECAAGLLSKLPKCEICDRPETRRSTVTGTRYCDFHSESGCANGEHVGKDLSYAEALRRLADLLDPRPRPVTREE